MLNKKYLLPSAYLAPSSYYALLINYPNSIIEQYEYFTKQTIRNRCSIDSANGPLILSIPKVRKSSSKTLMKDIQICYTEPWQKVHWNAIKSSYNSSPFFEYYMDEFSIIYHDKEKYPTGPWCKKGEWVIFARYAGSRLPIEGGEVRLLNDDEVLGTIDNPESVLHNI